MNYFYKLLVFIFLTTPALMSSQGFQVNLQGQKQQGYKWAIL